MILRGGAIYRDFSARQFAGTGAAAEANQTSEMNDRDRSSIPTRPWLMTIWFHAIEVGKGGQMVIGG